MSYRVSGLDPAHFLHLYGLSDDELSQLEARRYSVDAKPGFPDRIELVDMDLGETALLLNFEHQPANGPYRSRHAIFVREGATQAAIFVDEVPEVLSQRTVSLRAFDDKGEMVDADLAEGAGIDLTIRRLLRNLDVSYLHVHNAKRGCYLALVERA